MYVLRYEYTFEVLVLKLLHKFVAKDWIFDAIILPPSSPPDFIPDVRVRHFILSHLLSDK